MFSFSTNSSHIPELFTASVVVESVRIAVVDSLINFGQKEVGFKQSWTEG